MTRNYLKKLPAYTHIHTIGATRNKELARQFHLEWTAAIASLVALWFDQSFTIDSVVVRRCSC